jgi:iron complex transport system substrate-binding protein
MALRFIALALLAAVGSRAFAADSATAVDTYGEPKRIVSMNLCLDSVLVELVPREHILALSQYSRDPWRSTIADIAATLPYTNETAEEVVALQPDLVLASRHSAIATRNALKRVGVRFELFGVPQSIDESVAQIRRLARLLHREAEGEALVGRIHAAVTRARPAPGERKLTAAIYQPGGLTTGANSVTGQLMQIAGLENIAARYGVNSYRPLPLELLLSQPPDVLLVGDTTYGAPTQAERIVHHRALRALEFRLSREPFPARFIYCAGPAMVEALDALAAARRHASQGLLTRSAP